jgi:hypothetical protein
MKFQSSFTIEEIFSDKPVQLKLYQHIRQLIESIGQAEIKVSKTQIAFKNHKQFAWVWLPLPWDKKRPPNSIVLSFSLGKRIENSQIVQVVEPYPGRWMHHVIIQNSSDLNKEVQQWLKEAYEFGKN